ncbi:MAG: type II toxin-antitoxin system RelE/ParE family toxin [bacterium]
MKTVRLLQPAEQEMVDAALYYEARVSGLGDVFLDKISSALADIANYPERWPNVKLNIRRRLIHRFPYALFYRVDPDEVVVLAIAHLHRRPVYWGGRL